VKVIVFFQLSFLGILSFYCS